MTGGARAIIFPRLSLPLRLRLLGDAVVFVTACLVVISLVVLLRTRLDANSHLGDFGLLYESGRAANQGLDPYTSGNLNPPILLFPLRLLALVGPWTAYWLWTTISIACFVLGIVLLLRRYPARRGFLVVAWMASLAPLWYTLEFGQIYTALFLLTTIACLALQDRRPTLGGVLIGIVVAVKPNFIVWPLCLLAVGERKTVTASVMTFCALTAFPAMLMGLKVYSEWHSALPSIHLLSSAGSADYGNVSLNAIVTRLGVAPLGLVITPLLVIAAAWSLWKNRYSVTEGRLGECPGVLNVSFFALIIALLAGPLSWEGYILLLLPLFFAYSWSRETVLAAFLLAIPYWAIMGLDELNDEFFRVFNSIFAVAVVLLLIRSMRELGVLAEDSERSATAMAMVRD